MKFSYDGVIGELGKQGYTFNNYLEICTMLGKTPIELGLSQYRNKEGYVYRCVRDTFSTYEHTSGPIYYTDNWSSLKLEFLRAEERYNYAKRNRYHFNLQHILKVDIPEDVTDKPHYEAEYCEKYKNKLISDYISQNFVPFPEDEFLNWKKNRKVKKKEKSTGLIYYRPQYYDDRPCTEERGHVDLSKYQYVFKANKENAQKYWDFIRKTFKSFIMTKTEGCDLNKLEPSPLLKRMMVEAYKCKLVNKLGDYSTSSLVMNFIAELNPLVHQYMKDLNLENAKRTYQEDIVNSLIEVGNTLGFGADEVKLKFLDYHFDKMILIKKLARVVGYSSYPTLTEEDKHLIKRMYILERLVEKKKLDVEESVNENQLQLELA